MNKKLVLLIFFLLLISFASAKSYYLPKAEIYLQIQSDGLIEVEEKVSFDFSGKYTFAYRDIPKGYWQVSEIKVFEGTKELEKEISSYGNNTRIKWFYSAENQQKTFTIKYTLKNAITAYNDIAELNWKVWGEDWGVPLNELYGFIELPKEVKDANKVFVWGHPEVNGKIGLIENKKILFQVFNVGSNEWIEIRTAFPIELLSSTENTRIKNENGLEKIIEEEKNYVPQGLFPSELILIAFVILFLLTLIIGTLSKSKGAKVMAALFFFFIISVSLFFLRNDSVAVALIILQIVLFVAVWHFFGREPKIEYNAIYERDIPFNYSPAVVNALMNQWTKTPSLNQMTAEILDLCLKGKLKLEEIRKPGFLDKGEYKIHIKNSDTTDLPFSEIILINLISDAAKGKFEGMEVALSIASGDGKEHMALVSALINLPVGIRFAALTKQGVIFL